MSRLLLCRGSSSDESSDPLEESGTSFFFVAINLHNFSLVLLASSPSEESEFELEESFFPRLAFEAGSGEEKPRLSLRRGGGTSSDES